MTCQSVDVFQSLYTLCALSTMPMSCRISQYPAAVAFAICELCFRKSIPAANDSSVSHDQSIKFTVLNFCYGPISPVKPGSLAAYRPYFSD